MVLYYAKSLITVKIALIFFERDNSIKVSIRSKYIDISRLASYFGGGGHATAGGFEWQGETIDSLLKRVLNEIKKRGLLS